MAIKALVGSLGLAAIVVTSTVGVGVSPALAQGNSDCTCVISAKGSNPLGKISQASAGVFVAGSSSQAEVPAGTSLYSGSVVTTSASATASIDLGESCKFGLGGSMKVQIVARGSNMCVQVINQTLPPPAPGEGFSPGIIAAIAGGGLVVSLGFLSPASK
jgi:hypothetical protein